MKSHDTAWPDVSTTRPEELRAAWLTAARNGQLEEARGLLRAAVLSPAHANGLARHSYALVCLALCRRQNEGPSAADAAGAGRAEETAPTADASDGRQLVMEAVGAGVLFAFDLDSLQAFVDRRYASYQTPQTPPSPEEVRSEFRNAFLKALDDSPAAERADLRTSQLWDVELRTCQEVKNGGGVPLGGSQLRLSLGPALAQSLGLVDIVKQWIGGAPSVPLSANLPPQLLEKLGRSRINADDFGIAVEDTPQSRLRQLFGPLGPATLLLERGQWTELLDALRSVDASQSSFIQRPEERRWLEWTRRELMIDCHLKAAREGVGHVPLDIEEVKRQWNEILADAGRHGFRFTMASQLADAALARSRSLFEERTFEQRQKAKGDQRTNSDRCLEAVNLLRMAQSLTASEEIKKELPNRLYLLGRNECLRKNWNKGFDYYLDCLQLVPAENVVKDLVSSVGRFVKQSLDENEAAVLSEEQAGAVVSARDRLRKVAGRNPDLEGAAVEFQAAAAAPLLGRVRAASSQGQWEAATRWMIEALELSPEATTVECDCRVLIRLLGDEAASGEAEVAGCRDRLEAAFQAGADRRAEAPKRAKADGADSSTASSERLSLDSDELFQTALQDAEAERFAESVSKLRIVLKTAPFSDAVRQAGRRIAKQWVRHAASKRCTDDFLAACRAREEF